MSLLARVGGDTLSSIMLRPIVVPDAIKYDVHYLPHTHNAAAVVVQYPSELGRRLRHEHIVPLGLLAEEILGLQTGSSKSVFEIFATYCHAAVVTNEENDLLNKAKLGSTMPPGWSFGQNVFARYTQVGVALLPPLLGVE